MIMKKDFVLKNRLGLHVRASSEFVKSARRYASKVTLTYGGHQVDGKQIIKVMGLGVKCNEPITITTEGDDEEEAMNAIGDLIKQGFGESE